MQGWCKFTGDTSFPKQTILNEGKIKHSHTLFLYTKVIETTPPENIRSGGCWQLCWKTLHTSEVPNWRREVPCEVHNFPFTMGGWTIAPSQKTEGSLGSSQIASHLGNSNESFQFPFLNGKL